MKLPQLCKLTKRKKSILLKTVKSQFPAISTQAYDGLNDDFLFLVNCTTAFY